MTKPMLHAVDIARDGHRNCKRLVKIKTSKSNNIPYVFYIT